MLYALIPVSDQELITLPNEVIVANIVGANVHVFAKLLQTSNAVREVMESIDSLYYNLFKYVFRNEYVLLYDIKELLPLYSQTNTRLKTEWLSIFDSANGGHFLSLFGSSQQNVFLVDEIVPLNYRDVLQAWRTNGGRGTPFPRLMGTTEVAHRTRLYEIFQKCRESDAFALETANSFARKCPLYIPHASFYMESHHETISLALRIAKLLYDILIIVDYRMSKVTEGGSVTDLTRTLLVLTVTKRFEEPFTYRANPSVEYRVTDLVTKWEDSIMPYLKEIGIPVIQEMITAFDTDVIKVIGPSKEDDNKTRRFETINDEEYVRRIKDLTFEGQSDDNSLSLFKKLFNDTIAQEIGVINTDYYYTMGSNGDKEAGDTNLFLYCIQCHAKEAHYQDAHFSLPFCSNDCRDTAFATHVKFLDLS